MLYLSLRSVREGVKARWWGKGQNLHWRQLTGEEPLIKTISESTDGDH